MAKKKITTKAKNKIPEQTQSQQEVVITAMSALEMSEGWKMIDNNFRANIALIEQQILDKTSADGQPLEEHEVDDLRNKREIMLDLLNTPKVFVELAKSNGSTPVEDYDPYYKDAKEMTNDALEEMHNAAGGVPPDSG